MGKERYKHPKDVYFHFLLFTVYCLEAGKPRIEVDTSIVPTEF